MSTDLTSSTALPAFHDEDQRLHASHDEDQRLYAFLAHVRDAVALLDRQMNLRYISPAIEQILGYTPAEYVHLANRFGLLHPDDRFTTSLQTPGASVTRHHRITHKDGTDRWVEVTFTNLLNDPTVASVLVTVRDITEQKRLEEERQQLMQRERHARQAAELEQMRLRSLFAQAPALIHILRGPEHVFEFFHPLGQALVGGRDLTGMKAREALPEYEGQGYFELLDQVYQTGEPYHAQEMLSLLKAADGTLVERFFNFIFQRWYDVDGSVAGILNFAVEVTDQVRARQHVEALAEALQRNQENLERTNEELRRQRDELTALNTALEQASQARSQFIATMSHELRTPLAVILGFSQMLLQFSERANWAQRQKDHLRRILKNGQSLLALVNDVLDIAKIDSGRLEVTYSQVDLSTWLSSLVEEVQPLTLERQLSLTTHVEAGAESLKTDPSKLHQILLNLISNAIKFTEHGEVAITATGVTDSNLAGECIAIAVKDSGIGIPPGQHQHIFEAFYQVESGNTRRFGGTGLGLAIVYRLTTLLGGTIAIASQPGEGSTFTVTLPRQVEKRELEQPLRLASLPRLLPPPERSTRGALDTPAAVPAQGSALGGARRMLLAVDDNADLLTLLASLLENTPYEVTSVQDPEEVLDLAQELQPCAITLDVMMPRRNGWQVLYQLKANPSTAHIPVIMLTILAEQTIGYVLGADEYLIKPFERESLLEVLRHVVEQGSAV